MGSAGSRGLKFGRHAALSPTGSVTLSAAATMTTGTAFESRSADSTSRWRRKRLTPKPSPKSFGTAASEQAVTRGWTEMSAPKFVILCLECGVQPIGEDGRPDTESGRRHAKALGHEVWAFERSYSLGVK